MSESIVNDLLIRIDEKVDKIQENQYDQGKTLVRNTASLEEHIKRTNLLEEKMSHVESEVSGLKTHVTKINNIFGYLRPTKEKIKWLIIVVMLLGGSYGGVKMSEIKTTDEAVQFIQKIIK